MLSTTTPHAVVRNANGGPKQSRLRQHCLRLGVLVRALAARIRDDVPEVQTAAFRVWERIESAYATDDLPLRDMARLATEAVIFLRVVTMLMASRPDLWATGFDPDGNELLLAMLHDAVGDVEAEADLVRKCCRGWR